MKTVMDAINWFKGGNLLCEFHGRGLEDCDWVLLECLLQSEDCADKVGDICIGGVEFDSGFYRLICDYHSYAVEVALLSRATWIKGASLAEYQAADKEVLQPRSGNMKIDISSGWLSSGSGGGKSSFGVELDDKGLLKAFVSKEVVKMENKTVEVSGMVYEIGKLYLFSDGNGGFEIGELSSAGDINDGNGFMYQSKVKLRKSNKYEWWSKISKIDTQVGTITPAPVKLIDGEAYSFDYYNGSIGMISAVMRYREFSDCFYFDNTVFERKHCKNITRLVPEVE